MAAVKEDDVDYESDPEEAKRALTMRRREASDDEEGEMVDPRCRIESDVESEGQGAAEEYDDDVAEEEEGEELDEKELRGGDVADEAENEGLRSVSGDAEVAVEEGKKENEPFAVPTEGAFYMHDDRFRDNARGRNRRMFGGKKLWETQDDRKWGHDKFEEITLQERNYNEGTRNFRGRYRGRGKYRGGDRRNIREDISKVYDNSKQNQTPKVTKGRGFKKYDSLNKNKNEAPPQMQYRQRSNKTIENPPQATKQELESNQVSSTKQAFASSLNSASPPFYPSTSSSKETTSISPSNSTKGRNVIDSINMNKLHLNPTAQGRGIRNPIESSLEVSKFKSNSVGKEKGSVKSGGKGNFLYSGSQMMAVSGNVGSGRGDQSFGAAPTFLPVMPFGGQHPGSMGVPAVGMAFPGYVSQPNGLGNSEMTWLPVLAGAAGALGSAYGSPYIALDSAFHSRPPGQTSSSGASSKESNGNKANNEWKASPTPEATGDEASQRQKNTRRYTEMKFGQ